MLYLFQESAFKAKSNGRMRALNAKFEEKGENAKSFIAKGGIAISFEEMR